MAGDYGTYPVHKFKTSNIEPPRFNFEAPFSGCDDGSYIFFSPRGNVVSATFYIYDHEYVRVLGGRFMCGVANGGCVVDISYGVRIDITVRCITFRYSCTRESPISSSGPAMTR